MQIIGSTKLLFAMSAVRNTLPMAAAGYSIHTARAASENNAASGADENSSRSGPAVIIRLGHGRTPLLPSGRYEPSALDPLQARQRRAKHDADLMRGALDPDGAVQQQARHPEQPDELVIRVEGDMTRFSPELIARRLTEATVLDSSLHLRSNYAEAPVWPLTIEPPSVSD